MIKSGWLLYYLWGDTDFRDKAVAGSNGRVSVKSMYYEDDPTFLEHEALGDELRMEAQSQVNGQVIILADTKPLYHHGYDQWRLVKTGDTWRC